MLAHLKNTEWLFCFQGPVAYAHRQRSAALRAKTKQPDLYGRSTTKQPDLYGRSTTKQPDLYGRSTTKQPDLYGRSTTKEPYARLGLRLTPTYRGQDVPCVPFEKQQEDR
jgi:hypothetical protein